MSFPHAAGAVPVPGPGSRVSVSPPLALDAERGGAGRGAFAMTPREAQCLEIMRERGPIRTADVAAALGVTGKQAQRTLQRVRDSGLAVLHYAAERSLWACPDVSAAAIMRFRILEYAREPDGISLSLVRRKLFKSDPDSATAMISAMHRADELVEARSATGGVRYYASAECAAPWLAQQAAAQHNRRLRTRNAIASEAKPVRSPAQEIDYSRAKRTVCPSVGYDPRYQVPPGAKVFGAGFAAIGIGHDLITGRAWGK